MSNKVTIKARLAPSPTGYLHLGNAWSFLLSWLSCRKAKGYIVLRIEDIDPLRSKKEFIDGILEDLAWLGLDWDEICFQSQRSDNYNQALQILEKRGLVYKCFCTRKELRMLANAPHPGDMGAPYPGICRNLSPETVRKNILEGKSWNLRFKCPDTNIVFEDLIQGKQNFSPADIGGDFALKRSDNVFAYQLACAVDDGLHEMNLVVRGRDILPSAARQIMLLKSLDLPIPRYAHVPLLLDENGERLAKRHQGIALASLRRLGINPLDIVGFLGMLAGFNPYGLARSAGQLLGSFSFDKIPMNDIVLNDNTNPSWLANIMGNPGK